MSVVEYSDEEPTLPGSYRYYYAAANGLYLSYETGSHYAELYKDPRSIWIDSATSSVSAGTPVLTGDTIYLRMEIMFSNWLGMSADMPYQLAWAKIGSDGSFQFQIWSNLDQATGDT